MTGQRSLRGVLPEIRAILRSSLDINVAADGMRTSGSFIWNTSTSPHRLLESLMASLDSVPVLGQLRNATSPGEQTAALRHLKNQVIGHSLRKEQLVQHGLIDLLTHLLTTHVQSRPKPKKTSTNGSTLSPQSNGLSSSDEVRYQVLILIGSLAQGDSVL